MAYKPTVTEIKDLREKTSAGMALCKEALEKSDGDVTKAVEYVNDRSDVISRLYNITRAKIGLCKIAFADAEKDFQKAIEIIKERGWEGAVVDDDSVRKEGVLGTYVHGVGHKLVAVVELFCDTDFVAKNDDFKALAHDLAQQVAALGAEYATPEDVPQEVVEAQKENLIKSGDLEGKPEQIVEKILEGKVNKLYEEKCLIEQKFFKDEDKTIRNLVDEAISKLGEKIYIGKIYRIELGK